MQTNEKLKLFQSMLRIRKVELAIAEKYADQQMRCPVHLSIGQEAAAVAITTHLKTTDSMVSTHRGHAHYLAKGGQLDGLLGELYGKITGCAKGQGGSMHLVDHAAGFLASTSIVGGTIPIGVGAAFATKLKKEKNVSVVCLGDAALEEGVFHESANFAAVQNLPVIFYCENNQYSCYTHLRDRQPDRPLTTIGAAHGLKTLKLDGQNLFEATEKLKSVVDSVRAGEGPYFIELDTYRYLEHCGPNNDDNLDYRPAIELAHYRERDPIVIAKAALLKEGVSEKTFEEIELALTKEVSAAFEKALAAPFPDESELGAYIYA